MQNHQLDIVVCFGVWAVGLLVGWLVGWLVVFVWAGGKGGVIRRPFFFRDIVIVRQKSSQQTCANKILPGKLTCPLKINGWKMYFLSKQSFFRGHVSFLGCTFKNYEIFLSG